MVTNGCSRLAQGDDLGMRRGIGVGDVAVPSAADDAFAAHDHCSDRDLARFESALRGSQSLLHPQFVISSCHGKSYAAEYH
jgi:hypothetical protein